MMDIDRQLPHIRRALTAAAVGVPLLFAAGALVVHGWEARRFLLLYVAPFFVAFFAWARVRVNERPRIGAAAVDAFAIVLGAVRFVGLPVPFSGHMLFFAYSLATTRSIPYRMLALALAVETTWFKLVLWDDPRSWSLGIGMGLMLALARRLVTRSTPIASDA